MRADSWRWTQRNVNTTGPPAQVAMKHSTPSHHHHHHTTITTGPWVRQPPSVRLVFFSQLRCVSCAPATSTNCQAFWRIRISLSPSLLRSLSYCLCLSLLLSLRDRHASGSPPAGDKTNCYRGRSAVPQSDPVDLPLTSKLLLISYITRLLCY